MLDVKTMELSKVNVPYDLSLKGTDGILFYKNSLITIQNGVQPNRVVRHFLDASGNSFTRYEYIDNAHPAFGEPTIGSLNNNTLFYVANSQWSAYEDGRIKDPAELHPDRHSEKRFERRKINPLPENRDKNVTTLITTKFDCRRLFS